MTKPKNMAPEQEAEWKERRRAYLTDYSAGADARQKAKARSDRYRGKPGIRERDTAKIVERLKSDPAFKARDDERKAAWAKTEAGREKGRNWSRRYSERKRDEKHFDHFMASMAEEEGAS